MSRLRHDLKPYLMTLRMTRVKLIVYIEGKENDPIFYSQAIERFSETEGISTAVWRAQDIPGAADPNIGGSGGKPWLMKAARFWLRYMARQNRSYGCRLLFALDKDIDDICGRKLLDPHFVYTEGYAVENYMVSGTDLQNATERALSLMPGDLSYLFRPSQESWMKRSSILWREWVEYCIAAGLYHHSKKLRGYGVPSAVNLPFHTACNKSELESRYEALRNDIGAGVAEFDFVRAEINAHLNLEYSVGHENKYVKGEWYIDILFSHIENNPQLWGNVVQAGKSGIWAAIRTIYKLQDDTYLYYRSAFLSALSTTF